MNNPHSVVLLSILAIAAMAAVPVPNREPLARTPMTPLPLGSVRATGWLLQQLQLQRDGLTGHAEQVIPQLGSNSGWLGGTGKDSEGWEKGPYYVKGLVALAYTLDDAALKQKAQKWIDWSIASQKPDGSFGPASNNDWWPRMVMTYALRQYAEATGDPRVVPMLQKYIRYIVAEMPRRHLQEWGKARAGDMIDTAFWVYNRTGDPAMLEAADLLHKQAYDWTDIMSRNRFLEFGSDFHPKHAVNVTQAMKMPPVWYQRSKAPADRDAFSIGLKHLLAGTAMPLDVPTGTEMLAGRSAIQGVEMCTIVEQMLSDETAIGILGDPAIADALERTAYNAYPGAMTKDLKQYQYFTATNSVIATRHGQGFGQDYDDGFLPGPVSGFPCCCYNLHMGWPMLVQHAWMATDDGGIAAVVYGPTQVKTTLPTGEVTIAETTNYPFEPEVHLAVSVSKPMTFPLKLRVPGWCTSATISVNGQPLPRQAPGTFVTVRRLWSNGDKIELAFPMPLTTIPGVNGSVSYAAGPLVFCLQMPQETKIAKPGPDGFVQLEFTSPAPWNYALAIDPATPAGGVKVETRPMPAGTPFDPELSPVTLVIPARKVPGWDLVWTGHAAADPPVSPVASNESIELIRLVPFGAQTLRVTSFPVLGEPTKPANAFSCDFHDINNPGWVEYGGGWYVDGGKLHSAPNEGNGYGTHGMKAVATATDFTDFTFDADVTPSVAGDTGLIFRVTNPAIGPNAFDGYYVGVSPSDGKVLLGRGSAKDNQWTPITEGRAASKAGESVHVKVVATGKEIKVFVGTDTAPVITASDDTFKHGSIGVRQYAADAAKTAAAWGNVVVSRVKK